MEKFKEFGIEQVGQNLWNLSKYYPDGATHFVIANIEYEPNELGFKISSIGMRLIEYGYNELFEWIFAWTEYEKTKRRLEGEVKC